jgi:ribosomal protein L15E
VVAITPDVKRMMNSQHVILVGTANDQKIPNVSPRSSFYVDNDAIYWYEIFMHKSYQNFTKNNWVSVSVVDYSEFSGYQLKDIQR